MPTILNTALDSGDKITENEVLVKIIVETFSKIISESQHIGLGAAQLYASVGVCNAAVPEQHPRGSYRWRIRRPAAPSNVFSPQMHRPLS